MSDGTAVYPLQEGCDMRDDVLSFARAVLARWGNLKAGLTSSAPAPAEGEVGELADFLRGCADDHYGHGRRQFTRAADLLDQRQAAPVAVLVSERLPQPEDCDAEGRCWWGRPESDDWSADWTLATLAAINEFCEFCEFSPRVNWLPFNALPLPNGEVAK